MKRIILSFATISVLFFGISSCKKNDNSISVTIDDKASAEMLNNFFEKHKPKEEKFSIDASTGGVITLSSGTKINLPSNVFILPNGTPATGNVDLFVRDILNAGAMILADKPTITNDGKMLESFGEVIVKAVQNNNELKLNPKRNPVQVRVPIGAQNGANRDVPMWEGDTSISQTTTGYNHENQITSFTQQILLKKGVEWNQIPGFGISSAGNTIFPLDILGRWVNCDALYNDPRPKTTVLGYFGDKFNTETGTNYSGQEPTMLFFKTTGTNTLVKLYNIILNPAPGKEGLLSYQNMMPIGQVGTFLAISAKDGKFYAEMRDVTIPTPLPGKNYVGFDFNLQEVTSIQLLNLISQMNNK